MDIFSHALYGAAAVYPKYKTNRAQRYMAALFGILPDIIPFAPAFIYMFVQKTGFDPGMFFPNPQHWVFAFAVNAYDVTHSLVIFAAVALLVTVARKGKFYVPLIAWGLHVLMDIPTHPDFFQTPFLFPLSDYRVSWGIAWATPWMLLGNTIVVAILYIFILRDISKRKGFKTLTFLNSN